MTCLWSVRGWASGGETGLPVVLKMGVRLQGSGRRCSRGLRVADVAAFFGVRVGVAGEVVGADGAFLALPPGDPSVTFTQEGIRSAGTDGGFAQRTGDIAVRVRSSRCLWSFPRPN